MPIARSLATGTTRSRSSSIASGDLSQNPAPPCGEVDRDTFEDEPRPRPSFASAETLVQGRNRNGGRGGRPGGPAVSWPGGLGTSSRRPGAFGRSHSSLNASRSSQSTGPAASWRGGSFGTSSRGGGSFGTSSRRLGGPIGRSSASFEESFRSGVQSFRSGAQSHRSGVSQRRGMPPPLQSVRQVSFYGMPGGLGPEEDSLAGLGPFRRACGRIVDSQYAQLFMLALITVNAAMMGIATTSFVKDDPRMSKIFDVVDLVALSIFTAESALQMAFHFPRGFFRDGWLVFDLFIVILSWVSIDMVTLQGFRIFRALRFVGHVPMLRNLVTAILGILPSIASIFMLLALIFYIFAVMFTTLFKDYYVKGYTEQDYFGSLQLTFFTLFQFLCLDEWSAIAYEVTKEVYWAWIVFIAFILMSAFVVVNLLIAVICDALQILRMAEDMAEEGIREQRTSETCGWGEDPATAEVGGGAMGAGFDVDEEFMTNVMLRQQVVEMQGMLNEMVMVQEHMGRAIRRLCVAVGERIEERPEGSGGAGKGAAGRWLWMAEPEAS